MALTIPPGVDLAAVTVIDVGVPPFAEKLKVRSDVETASVVFAKPFDRFRWGLARLLTVILCVPALAVALVVTLIAEV